MEKSFWRSWGSFWRPWGFIFEGARPFLVLHRPWDPGPRVPACSDFHFKDKRLRALFEKARNKNPDEFYFAMLNAKTKGGKHVLAREVRINREIGGNGKTQVWDPQYSHVATLFFSCMAFMESICCGPQIEPRSLVGPPVERAAPLSMRV